MFIDLLGHRLAFIASQLLRGSPSFPWPLLLLPLPLLAGLGLAASDLQLRPVPKEPAVFSLTD